MIVAVGTEKFAFELAEVREIARGCWPSRLPRAPFGCLGALTVRGESMPLLDLGVLVGARRPARGEALEKRLLDAHLVVLGSQPPMAVLVDRVLNVSSEGELHESASGARVVTPQGETVLLRTGSLVGANRRKLLRGAMAREAGRP